MTPFGEKLRKLRSEKGITQQQLAKALGVSSAYLSALEHGKRGRPTYHTVLKIIGYYNVIWDDAEELQKLAMLSDPRVVNDTAGLPPLATLVANELSERIAYLDDTNLERIKTIMEAGTGEENRRKLTRRERLIKSRREKLRARQEES